jgi:stearoyl-CoA desaturase (delta-9 desaturase)
MVLTTLTPWAAGVLPNWMIVALRGLPMLAVHLACIALIWVPIQTADIVLFLVMTYVRGLAITVGYHRYFSHRSFKTSRPVQFILGFLGCSTLQMGPLWWTAHHRHHHRHSDEDNDIHSPSHGVLWSHFIWAYTLRVMQPDWKTVRDFTHFPEIRFLEKNCHLPGLLLAGMCWLIGGWGGLLLGFCFSTVFLYFVTNAVNSIGHLFGSRNYGTRDNSRNSFILGVLALGDGWHNNHHYYPKSAQHGFFWWEFDGAFRFIRLMKLLGLVWDVRTVPEIVKREIQDARRQQKAEAERMPSPVAASCGLADPPTR